MSLPALPDDALARICSYLPRRDRESLSNTNTTLQHTLRQENCSLWQDVFMNKFGCTTSSKSASAKLKLFEYASDSLCYNFAWEKVVSECTQIPIATKTGYIATGRKLFNITNDSEPITLQSRATAITTSSHTRVAVAWDRAISVYKKQNNTLHTTRPLRGHTSAIRSAKFIDSENLISTGADDGTIRLHDIKSRRTRGVLRAHSGAVIQQKVISSTLFSRAGERVVSWDLNKQRPTRTYAGGNFCTDSNANVIYTLSPGDSCCIRVYDVRQDGVAAFLTPPRYWGRRKISSFALDTDFNGVVAAVGERGIAHWPASGKWEANSLVDPLRSPPITDPIICLRGSVAISVASGMNCELVAASLDRNFSCFIPWPGMEGGAFTQLLPIEDNRLLACREREVLLFNHRKKGASIDMARARKAIENANEDGYADNDYSGRFWQSCVIDSDDDFEREQEREENDTDV